VPHLSFASNAEVPAMSSRLLIMAVLALLLNGCESRIHRAAYEGDTKTVMSLIDRGHSITEEGFMAGKESYVAALSSKPGDTVWETAIMGGHEETVSALLDRGLSVNQKGRGGVAPALLACLYEHPKLVNLLLDKGADSKAMVNGWTLLHCAALNGYYRVAERSLQASADPNANQGKGAPLHLAIREGHEKIVQLLLAHGANVDLVDDKGMTPLKIAVLEGRTAIARMLRQAGAKDLGVAQLPSGSTEEVAVSPPPTVSLVTSDVDRVPALRTATKKHAYAVVIGIEQYREQLPKANFAAHDASVVGDYLTRTLGYPEENVVVRLNDKATKTDLEKYFEGWLPNNVEKDSSVFVYFSGHGAPHAKTGDAYLVPYDGDPTFVDKTGYSLKRLYAALDKLPAKDVTVVLDSCFSGAGGRSVLAEGARPMGLSLETQAPVAGRVTVLAASSGDQISNTFKEQGHGLLTYYFLKGLQGEGDGNKDGFIDMAELYDYVKPNVQRVARKQYNNEQTPQLLASPDLLKRGGGRLLERAAP
jgi:ankyrin repeat protein